MVAGGPSVITVGAADPFGIVAAVKLTRSSSRVSLLTLVKFTVSVLSGGVVAGGVVAVLNGSSFVELKLAVEFELNSVVVFVKRPQMAINI